MADDFPPGKRRLRRFLPRRTTYNVVCELGDAEAERTVVLIAHHDAAHSGLVFHPALPELADRLGLTEKTDTSPPLMAPVVGGPVLAALGAATGRKLLARVGLFLGLGSVAAMADIGLRKSVPAANDNGTAVVALLDLARRFLADPPQGIRVVLLSTGSEESFSEGIKAFGERHFDSLPKESTFFLCLETLGATHLLALRGEGFLKMRDYPPRALAFVERVAGELDIWLYPNLRTYNGTDGLELGGGRLRDRRPLQLHRPKAAGPLPLAQRHSGQRQLLHSRKSHRSLRGSGPAARQPLAVMPKRLAWEAGVPPPGPSPLLSGEGHPRLPHHPNVTNCNVTNPDYAIGILRYSIRARAIP